MFSLDFLQALQEHRPEGSRISGEILFKELPQDDPTRRRPDIAKARRLLGWEPKISLREGLERSLSFFQSCVEREKQPSPTASK